MERGGHLVCDRSIRLRDSVILVLRCCTADFAVLLLPMLFAKERSSLAGYAQMLLSRGVAS